LPKSNAPFTLNVRSWPLAFSEASLSCRPSPAPTGMGAHEKRGDESCGRKNDDPRRLHRHSLAAGHPLPR
jgi:hypothetical protein